MAEVSDFKFGMQLGFAKGHYKITPKEKSGRSPWVGKLPKLVGFPFNISVTAEASDFNLVCSLGLPRPIIKSRPEEKWAWPWASELPKIVGFPFNISATTEDSDFKILSGWWGLPRPIIKSHSEKKRSRFRGTTGYFFPWALIFAQLTSCREFR